MSEKKKPRGLPRMASRRRKELIEKAAEVPVAKTEAALPPMAVQRGPDLLADFLKSEGAGLVAAPVACGHKHLVFKNMGAVLQCVDCPRRFHILLDGGTVPDLGYFNPATGELESRHTPFEPARIIPAPKPVKKP